MKRDRLSVFIRSPLAVIVAAFLIVLLGLVELYQMKKIENELAVRITKSENLLLEQQQVITSLSENITSLQKENRSTAEALTARARELSAEIAAQKAVQDRLATLQSNSVSQAKTALSNLEESFRKTHPDLRSLIDTWRPKTALVTCNFTFKDTGSLYAQSRGSGTLNTLIDGKVNIATNKHVVTDSQGYGPSSCVALVNGVTLTIPMTNIMVASKSDRAFLIVPSPSQEITRLALDFKACPKDAATGDQIVVLGYPGIGAVNDLTATEGIISGSDGDYYITSAKVEKGNSGGAAILAANNCYIGIPSFVERGGLESLARILKASVVFK